MKRKTYLCLLIAGFSLNAMAQLVDGKAATQAAQESFTGKITEWDKLRVNLEGNAYHMPDVEIGYKKVENTNTTFTFAFSYLHGFSISQKKPFFLETGVGLKWGHYNEVYDKWIYNYTNVKQEILNIWTLEVPVNVGYLYTKDYHSDWSIYPYTGLYFRMHVTGQLKAQTPSGYRLSVNPFSKDSMGEAFDRFQCGWQLGCDFQYRRVSFGWYYGIDFNKVWIDTRVNTWGFNVGYQL